MSGVDNEETGPGVSLDKSWVEQGEIPAEENSEEYVEDPQDPTVVLEQAEFVPVQITPNQIVNVPAGWYAISYEDYLAYTTSGNQLAREQVERVAQWRADQWNNLYAAPPEVTVDLYFQLGGSYSSNTQYWRIYNLLKANLACATHRVQSQAKSFQEVPPLKISPIPELLQKEDMLFLRSTMVDLHSEVAQGNKLIMTAFVGQVKEEHQKTAIIENSLGQLIKQQQMMSDQIGALCTLLDNFIKRRADPMIPPRVMSPSSLPGSPTVARPFARTSVTGASRQKQPPIMVGLPSRPVPVSRSSVERGAERVPVEEDKSDSDDEEIEFHKQWQEDRRVEQQAKVERIQQYNVNRPIVHARTQEGEYSGYGEEEVGEHYTQPSRLTQQLRPKSLPLPREQSLQHLQQQMGDLLGVGPQFVPDSVALQDSQIFNQGLLDGAPSLPEAIPRRKIPKKKGSRSIAFVDDEACQPTASTSTSAWNSGNQDNLEL